MSPGMHVTANSKEVRPGSIFFALKGSRVDGHDFIDEARARGASKIYSERAVEAPDVEALGPLARRKLAEMASEMYDHPSRHLIMIGITGTSGKTTTSYLIQHLLEKAGLPCARLGTNGGYFAGKEVETANTTPDALTLQAWLASVRDLGARAVVMETSSHALHQDRCYGIAWDACCFLNLSREHLDYHPTLDHYFNAKALLFTLHTDFAASTGKSPIRFSNRDCAFGARLIREHPEVLGFSPSHQIRQVRNTPSGVRFEVELGGLTHEVTCPLFGSFQTETILAALSVVTGLGVNPEIACGALADFPGVPGRMETIPNDLGITVFVDYAHKPEALEKVLLAIQGGTIITVFGCGGDRDKTKRPVMGEIASRLSRFVIVTSDNPRSEPPEQIIAEIEAGIRRQNYRVIPDRAQAIREAIRMAQPGDRVLIAGKGHETYQLIAGQSTPFDDREEARKAIALRRAGNS
jgi:UDP-N-acetylmuramoyl-L-alanyl-D-glutamate--2,6-diaminopimelate ligase